MRRPRAHQHPTAGVQLAGVTLGIPLPHGKARPHPAGDEHAGRNREAAMTCGPGNGAAGRLGGPRDLSVAFGAIFFVGILLI